MKTLAERVGMEVIQDAACESAARAVGSAAASSPDRSLSSWARMLKEPDEILRHAIAFDIVEDGETAFEIQVLEGRFFVARVGVSEELRSLRVYPGLEILEVGEGTPIRRYSLLGVPSANPRARGYSPALPPSCSGGTAKATGGGT